MVRKIKKKFLLGFTYKVLLVLLIIACADSIQASTYGVAQTNNTTTHQETKTLASRWMAFWEAYRMHILIALGMVLSNITKKIIEEIQHHRSGRCYPVKPYTQGWMIYIACEKSLLGHLATTFFSNFQKNRQKICVNFDGSSGFFHAGPST
ncbi:MAG: hypothetical protein ACPGC9_01705 [Cytophagales bacterium]